MMFLYKIKSPELFLRWRWVYDIMTPAATRSNRVVLYVASQFLLRGLLFKYTRGADLCEFLPQIIDHSDLGLYNYKKSL